MKRSVRLALLLVLVMACGGSPSVESTTSTVAQSTPAVETTAAAATTTTEPAETVDAPELAGTSWNVTDYSQGPGRITNVWKTSVTISFAADGTVSGSAGCNTYGGTWEVSGLYDQFESGVPDPNDGQVLSLTDLSWTEMACQDEAIMEQEAEILDLIQRGGRWVLRRGNFNLRTADGEFLFEAEPV